jgi:uncharacterized membrane protein YphA (DoxX/SURF4 family)
MIEQPVRWNFFHRVVFRFAFVYLLLYLVPFPIQPILTVLGSLPMIVVADHPFPEPLRFLLDGIHTPVRTFWERLVVRTGHSILGIEIRDRPYTSGDTTWNYVQIFCMVMISAVATAAWSYFDRRRQAYPKLNSILRTYVRFFLAYHMIGYGAVKIIKLQFPAPDTEWLLTPYGDSSPMRLAWTFMGASEGYNRFTGAGELLAGLLLVFGRTSLLGALVAFGVMLQVAALNFCYDIPVKLFSTHLVFFSAFLLLPDVPWLFRVFILGRREETRPPEPSIRWKWLERSGIALLLAFLAVSLASYHHASIEFGDRSPKPPLHGLWLVDEFSLDGTVRPPLTTDAIRWQHVIFTRREYRGSLLVVTSMTGSREYYCVEVDEDRKTLVVSGPVAPPQAMRYQAQFGERGLAFGWEKSEDTPPKSRLELTWREAEPGVIEVEGSMDFGKHPLRVRLRHVGEDKFLLLNRGFHLVNENAVNAAERHEP